MKNLKNQFMITAFLILVFLFSIINDAFSQQEKTITNAGVDWSPDGESIVFLSDRDGNREIYVMKPDGSGQKRLTFMATDDKNPTYSPDGSKIAFYAQSPGKSEVFVMNADGSNIRQITHTDFMVFNPSWSRDGSKIALFSMNSELRGLYVQIADGSDMQRITENPSFGPSWSPVDKNKLAFAESVDGVRDIYIIDITTVRLKSTIGTALSFPAPTGNPNFMSFMLDSR